MYVINYGANQSKKESYTDKDDVARAILNITGSWEVANRVYEWTNNTSDNNKFIDHKYKFIITIDKNNKTCSSINDTDTSYVDLNESQILSNVLAASHTRTDLRLLIYKDDKWELYINSPFLKHMYFDVNWYYGNRKYHKIINIKNRTICKNCTGIKKKIIEKINNVVQSFSKAGYWN